MPFAVVSGKTQVTVITNFAFKNVCLGNGHACNKMQPCSKHLTRLRK